MANFIKVFDAILQRESNSDIVLVMNGNHLIVLLCLFHLPISSQSVMMVMMMFILT